MKIIAIMTSLLLLLVACTEEEPPPDPMYDREGAELACQYGCDQMQTATGCLEGQGSYASHACRAQVCVMDRVPDQCLDALDAHSACLAAVSWRCDEDGLLRDPYARCTAQFEALMKCQRDAVPR